MSKFNTVGATTISGAEGPVATDTVSAGPTHQGGAGFDRSDAKSELFLLAVSNMVSESTFYETAQDRDSRFVELVQAVAEDGDWTGRFVHWLRYQANMRSAALVLAVEAVRYRTHAGFHSGNRMIMAGAFRRADEPGEALAYWTANYGRRIPKPIKRGIADAAVRLYNEKSLLKYDTASHGFRFADVIDLTHPVPETPAQSVLFKYALDRRHANVVPGSTREALPTIYAHEKWKAIEDKRAALATPEGRELFERAGVTWEALSGEISGGMDAAAWEAVLPQMGYMAILRNLRNFEQAGVSAAHLEAVTKYLADPEEVAKSRQLPMRFLSAYQATKDSLRFGHSIELALQASLANVPELGGRSLILVDRSGSMYWDRVSARSDLTRADAAAVFGSALALRAVDADLVQFGTDSERVPFTKGDSVLPLVNKFGNMGSTYTRQAVEKWFDGHDRVIIVTDEQVSYDQNLDNVLPKTVPLYTWNLAGYKRGHAPGGRNRHTFGGLSDQAFALIPLLEAGQKADWSF